MRWFLIWLGRIVAVVALLALAVGVAFVVLNAASARRARKLAEREPSTYLVGQFPTLILDHVRVIDGTGAPPSENQSIVIKSGKIEYVGPSSQQPTVAGAKVWDMTGRTVFPGIVGMHEHLFTTAPNFGGKYGVVEQATVFPLLYLAAGVTTLRTAGSIAPERDLAAKHKIDQGEAAGPEMFLTAPYLEGSPAIFPEMHSLRDDREARQAVAHWAEQGMTSFKAYVQITPAELRAAIEEAHAHGLKITGHLCTVGFTEAADLGIDNLEHGLLTDTEFYSKKQPDICPNRDAFSNEYTNLDVESQPVQDMVRHLVARHVAVTSTLAVFEDVLGKAPKEYTDAARKAMTWKAWLHSRLIVAVVGHLHQDSLLQKEMAFERDFVKAGGTLLAGCDPTGAGSALAGFGDQREIQLLVQAGFSPVEAIQIATKNGADFLGIADRVGTVSSGKQADLVVVNGNPAADISDIRKVEFVFRKGVAYDPAKLIEGIDGVVGVEN